MIGARAFLLDMAFPFIWVLIALAIVVVVLKSKKGVTEAPQPIPSKTRIRGLIAIIVLALGLLNGAFRLSRQLQNRSALHDLTTESVEFVQVGETKLEAPPEVSSVVDALRDSQWFVHTAGDGGWAQPVNLVIQLKSGEKRRYRIGRLLKQEGAVIDFINQDPNSQFVRHYGYAWAKGLPQALDRIGSPLPSRLSKSR
jgi:hypothetical protein